jgi:hypothetical protein
LIVDLTSKPKEVEALVVCEGVNSTAVKYVAFKVGADVNLADDEFGVKVIAPSKDKDFPLARVRLSPNLTGPAPV